MDINDIAQHVLLTHADPLGSPVGNYLAGLQVGSRHPEIYQQLEATLRAAGNETVAMDAHDVVEAARAAWQAFIDEHEGDDNG